MSPSRTPPWGTARLPVAEADATEEMVFDAEETIEVDMMTDIAVGQTAFPCWSPRRWMTSRDGCICRTQQHDQMKEGSDMCKVGGNAVKELGGWWGTPICKQGKWCVRLVAGKQTHGGSDRSKLVFVDGRRASYHNPQHNILLPAP